MIGKPGRYKVARDRLPADAAAPNPWCEKLLHHGFAHAEEVTASPDHVLLGLGSNGQRVLTDLRAALPCAPLRHAKFAAGSTRAPRFE